MNVIKNAGDYQKWLGYSKLLSSKKGILLKKGYIVKNGDRRNIEGISFESGKIREDNNRFN